MTTSQNFDLEKYLTTPSFLDTMKKLPLLIEAPQARNSEFLADLLNSNRVEIEKRCNQYGGILFRGFGVNSVNRFQKLVQAFLTQPMNYLKGDTPRSKVGKNIYTSTEYPEDYFIPLHNEMSYTSSWPKKLLFACLIPPTERGETPIANSQKIYQSMPKDICNEFEQKGIRYIRNLCSQRGVGVPWQTVFGCQAKSDVEVVCKKAGIEFTWGDHDSLKIVETLPAVINHRVTGEKVWFNQADGFHPYGQPEPIRNALLELYEGNLESMPHYATFGDGSEISKQIVETILHVVEENSVLFKWQKGDLLILDNEKAAHGRNSYQGERKILASMS